MPEKPPYAGTEQFTTEQINAWLANPPQLGDPGFEDYSMWKFLQEWEQCARPEEHIQLANNDWILAGDLKVGDEVATSEDTQKVTRVERVEGSPRCEVFFEEGDSIVSSYSHPYFVKDKGFVKVIDLEKGDVIGELVVDSKKSFPDGPVISLSVDKAETYMLRGGTEENPVPVLSHNKTPAEPDRPDNPQTDPNLPATTPTETEWFNPDGTLKQEYLDPILQQMGESPYLQSLMGGYTQKEDVDTAIETALGNLGLGDYAQLGDVDASILAALQDFNIDDQIGDAMKLWGDDFKTSFTKDYDISQYVTEDVLQQMIANAQLQGMTEDQIRDMIKTVMGDSMSDADINSAIEQAVAAAQEETQKSILTTEQIQDMIDAGLANGLTPAEIQTMIEQYAGGMDPAVIAQMIADSQASLGELGGLTETEIRDMIQQAIKDGLTPEQIQEMIANATGGTLTSEQIQALITEAQATLASLGGLTEAEIREMITQALKDGLTPEQIQQMVADATGGVVDSATIQQMIADAQATLASLGGLTEAEIQEMIAQGIADGLTPEQIQDMIVAATEGAVDPATIQQMITDAIAASQTGQTGEGLSMEDIQALLDSGYMTADQINALMAESGYLGQEGVDSSVQAALDAALGEGGAISSAIAAALQATGGGGETGGGETTPTEPVPAPNYTIPTSYTPYTDYTSPYGSVSPYDMMGPEQFGGTTPFSGGVSTGAAQSGISGLDLGDASAYNYDIPITAQSGLYPSGIDPRYFDPVPEPFPLPPHKDPLRKEEKGPIYPDFFNTYSG
jgi:DNA-binding transcriptional regulator YhcF (GntR family)